MVHYVYMLNPFPIQFLALFAYFVLRVIVGTVLMYLGLLHASSIETLKETFTRSWWPYGRFSAIVLALTEFITGAMFVLGYATQIAAIVVFLMSLKLILLRSWFTHDSIPPRTFYLLLLGVSLSLFITGAGIFAFDLPI